MTAAIIYGWAGVLLSAAFKYIPGLNKKYAALSSEWKQLIMLGCLVVVAGLAYGAACLEWYDGITCDVPGLKELLSILLTAAVGNVTAYKLLPEVKSVREVKAGRVQ